MRDISISAAGAGAAALACAVLAGCGADRAAQPDAIAARDCPAIASAPVWLAGGSFVMGSDQVYAEEGPPRLTQVEGFWIDPHEVTNAQFAEFAAATGHVTIAEQPVDPAQFALPSDQIPPDMLKPGSAVFVAPERPSTRYVDWWRYVPGANWRWPDGPGGPEADPRLPVVHLAFADMQAYAAWRGGRLPSEAEWEYAANAGSRTGSRAGAGAGSGKNIAQPGPDAANSWQGVFPVVNETADGFAGAAPVGCYAPNAFGLYDMVGNVWEVTADLYRAGHDPAATANPRGPSEADAYDPLNPGLVTRVMKGGSYLCAPNYCRRYRPEARQGRDPGLGASNVGFRLVYDRPPA